MLYNRRKLRHTGHLVSWALEWLKERGYDPRDVIRAVYNAGRRRGRAELAAELAARFGLAVELELELDLPPLRATWPGHAPIEATPRYVHREVVTAMLDDTIGRFGAIPARSREPRKP